MTKRSTEDVLRAEVKSAAAAVDRAKKALADAAIRRADADRLEAAREKELDDLKAALRRSEAALDAFLPGQLEAALDATKERQETTGTHDPADLDGKSGTGELVAATEEKAGKKT